MLKNRYLAAVSGGPDSMALLSQFKHDIVGVCHVNYHYRSTSNYDQSIVEKYCKKYGIKLYVLNINSSVYTTGEVKNFEN
jgi:tRNA(Ile)-lysidine synthase